VLADEPKPNTNPNQFQSQVLNVGAQ